MNPRPMKKTDADKPWARRKDRKNAHREERQYILVASEDGKSSVCYFEALNDMLKSHSATVGVIPKGTGRSTQSLIDFVKKHRGKWLKEVQEDIDIDDFNEIWVAFDRDDFPKHKFDNAINSAVANGFHAAWSNECFELWYLLHFTDRVTAISRKDIYDELTNKLELKKNYTAFKGKEGKVLVHEKMAGDSNVVWAIKRARKLYNAYLAAKIPPHKSNPCTKVFELVEKLLRQIEH